MLKIISSALSVNVMPEKGMTDTHIIQCFRLYVVEVWELVEDAPEFNSCANITKGISTN